MPRGFIRENEGIYPLAFGNTPGELINRRLGNQTCHCESLAVELAKSTGPKVGAKMNAEPNGEKVTAGMVKAS